MTGPYRTSKFYWSINPKIQVGILFVLVYSTGNFFPVVIMIHMKKTPIRAFVKIDYHVINSPALSDKSELLYVRLSKLPQGSVVSNQELCKLFRISEKTLLLAKRELESCGLLCTRRISKRQYMNFLGNSTVSAEQFMAEYFEELDNDNSDILPRTNGK